MNRRVEQRAPTTGVVAGIDPDGDEGVVSRGDGSEATVVHRERYHP